MKWKRFVHNKLFIMAGVHKNTSFVMEDNYTYGHNKVVIVLHSIINDCIVIRLFFYNYLPVLDTF